MTVIGSLLEVWPDAVTVIEAAPGLIGNDPLAGGRSKVIDVSLQLVIVTFAPSKGAPQLVFPCESVR